CSLTGQRLVVDIWGDACVAELANDEVNTALSRFLGTRVRLVFMAADTVRPVEQAYIDRTPLNGQSFRVGFADAYQALVIGQASLDAVNERMSEPLDMTRFRPNIVVRDAIAFDEDDWHQIESDGVVMYGVKNCSRCGIPAIDPTTGVIGK